MRRATTFAIGAAAVIALTSTASRVLKSQGSPDGCSGVPFFVEQFDSFTPPALPPGWVATNAIDPDGIFWVTSDSGDPSPPADSPPNAAFVNDPSAISDKRLDSIASAPIPGTACVQVTFRNNFSLQEGFDGGVLEVSFDLGATFQDVLVAGGLFEAGGYNGTISACCGNPLAGRQAWTGNSAGFIATTVDLPILGTPSIVLRWRMGSDISGSDQGWRIDSVVVHGAPKQTPPPPTPTPTPTPPPTATPTRPTPAPRARPTPLPRPTPPR
jgi:hypothetical protein